MDNQPNDMQQDTFGNDLLTNIIQALDNDPHYVPFGTGSNYLDFNWIQNDVKYSVSVYRYINPKTALPCHELTASWKVNGQITKKTVSVDRYLVTQLCSKLLDNYYTYNKDFNFDNAAIGLALAMAVNNPYAKITAKKPKVRTEEDI